MEKKRSSWRGKGPPGQENVRLEMKSYSWRGKGPPGGEKVVLERKRSSWEGKVLLGKKRSSWRRKGPPGQENVHLERKSSGAKKKRKKSNPNLAMFSSPVFLLGLFRRCFFEEEAEGGFVLPNALGLCPLEQFGRDE